METGFSRIKQLVSEHPNRKLQTLMHLVNVETLKEAHEKMEAGKASGVDEVTKGEYEKNLEYNLENLINRMKTFSYHPQPARRVYIEKEGKKELRPLGIPAYEDKLVQSVISEILETIYEPMFLGCSYGFRKGLSQHDAIKYLNKSLFGQVNWVVDVDIKAFFDTVNHEWLMKCLEHRIQDKNLLRYIVRFLKAGIMENGRFIDTENGVPQGGCCSPILSNIYLHFAVDLWFEIRAKKKCQGYADMVRYADDIVFCFQHEEEAKAFYETLKARLKEAGLELSEEKSKIIRFGRTAGKDAETFDFLGFTVVTGKSRKGKYIPKMKTSEKKLKTKRVKVKEWLQKKRHLPIRELIYKTNARLRGHYNYYGISHNYEKLKGFFRFVTQELKKTLNRRSQKDKTDWLKFNKILKNFPLVKPKIMVPLW